MNIKKQISSPKLATAAVLGIVLVLATFDFRKEFEGFLVSRKV